MIFVSITCYCPDAGATWRASRMKTFPRQELAKPASESRRIRSADKQTVLDQQPGVGSPRVGVEAALAVAFRHALPVRNFKPNPKPALQPLLPLMETMGRDQRSSTNQEVCAEQGQRFAKRSGAFKFTNVLGPRRRSDFRDPRAILYAIEADYRTAINFDRLAPSKHFRPDIDGDSGEPESRFLEARQR